MHPTQHSTHYRKPEAASERPTDNDIIRAIRDISAHQSTSYLLIAELRIKLDLCQHDLEWLRAALTHLGQAGRIYLRSVEVMAKMPTLAAAWFVRNASGIPCHEVCLSDSERLTPVTMTPGEAVRAMSDGLQLLWLNQPRHRPLLQRAAQHSRTFRVQTAPMPQTAA